MIYRHLRQLEADDILKSGWITEGSRPAKRMYSITTEGDDFLVAWIEYMQRQAVKINRFVTLFEETGSVDNNYP